METSARNKTNIEEAFKAELTEIYHLVVRKTFAPESEEEPAAAVPEGKSLDLRGSATSRTSRTLWSCYGTVSNWWMGLSAKPKHT